MMENQGWKDGFEPQGYLRKRWFIPFVVSLSNHERNKSNSIRNLKNPSTGSGRTEWFNQRFP